MDTQQKKISIIVTYLPVDEDMKILTHNCIEKIKEYTYNPFELVLVINGLTDEIFGEKIRVMSDNNIGNAKAWDRGVDASENDIIVIMDNDVYVGQNWDKEMIDRLDDEDVGVAFPYSILGTDDYRATEYRGRKDGFCFALKRSTYDMCGPFLQDQPFHSYYEDDNFFMNVINKGLKLVSCSNSKVFHKGQGTTKKIMDTSIKEGIENNKKWFENKWHGEYPCLTK